MTVRPGERLKRTPLYGEHLELRARMAAFGGWDMPIQYDGIIAEAMHTRSAAAVFDTCHMGEFLVKGDPVSSGLDRITPLSLKDIPVGACRYSVMLNEAGGIIDDLVVYHMAGDEWFIVVNAGDISGDAGHIRGHLTDKASFEDLSDSLGKIDVQGPRSRDVVKRIVAADGNIDRLAYYTFGKFTIPGGEAIVSRTGYTGELGYELYVPAGSVVDVWKELLGYPEVKPAGLGSRDILRLEMGYNLYGSDIDGSVTPLEAGLGRHMDLDKDFIGRDALLRQKSDGLKRKRAFFTASSRRAPRHGYKIFSGSEEIGMVTSGTFSPNLARGIGMGFVKPGYEKPGSRISIRSDQAVIEAGSCARPFYRKGSLHK